MRMNQLDTTKVYDKNMDFTITSAQAEKIEHKYEGTLTQKQLLFVESKASISFFGGSRGGGKSHVLRFAAANNALKYPGTTGVFIRSSLKDAWEHFLKYFKNIVPDTITKGNNKIKIWTANSIERTIKFENGSTIKMGRIDNAGDVEDMQGFEFDFIYWDEIGNTPPQWIDKVLASNRSSIQYNKDDATYKDYAPRAYFTANPGGIAASYLKSMFIEGYEKIINYKVSTGEIERNEDWDETVEGRRQWLLKRSSYAFVWEDFVKDSSGNKMIHDITGQAIKKTLCYIPAVLYDNPKLKDDHAYLSNLKKIKDTDPELYEAWVYGDWDTNNDRFFKTFTSENIFEPTEETRKAIGTRMMAMDKGFNPDPTAILFAYTDKSGITRIVKGVDYVKIDHETIAKDLIPSDLEELEWKKESVQYFAQPHDAHRKDGYVFRDKDGNTIGENISEIYEHHTGISSYNIKKGNDNDSQWEKLEELFLTKKLLISSDCDKLIQEINDSVIDKKKRESSGKKAIKKTNDEHYLSALRYLSVTLNLTNHQFEEGISTGKELFDAPSKDKWIEETIARNSRSIKSSSNNYDDPWADPYN